MPAINYFEWDVNPILLKIDQIHLPFAVSVVGLMLALVLYYLGYSYLEKQKLKQLPEESANSEPVALPASWTIGLIVGSVIIGQLFTVPPGLWIIHAFGPIRIHWYGLMWAIAFILGYYLGMKMFSDAGKSQERLDSLLIYIMIGTVIGARLGHVLFYQPDYYFAHPSEIIKIWHGGLASHGAAVGILIAIWLYVRKYPDMKYLWVLDRVVIPVAIGGAFVRVGNFFNSEIIGHVTHVPWAIVFERVDAFPRHPSMLYEAVCYLIGFFILWWIYKHYKASPPKGLLLGVFLVYVFTGRFLIEYTKVRQADFTAHWPITMGQLLSIPFVLFGIWLLVKKVDYSEKKEPAD
ncbi:MAG TPA: prolipoprotein diacylglyceryl transferase [Balneolales bacterium]|nr:prolipoprotein diacylglyceryl transferase [Balneolales bacterium]